MALNPEHIRFEGKSAPMTVITPLTRWKRFLVRPVLCWFSRRKLPEVDRLKFIHFARWAVIDREHFTRSAPELRPDYVRRPYFLFSTNFNGPWDQYIDSFSLVAVIRTGIDAIWGTSSKFPKAFPIRRFKRYIRYHQYPVDAYYNAYPDASIRDVISALKLEQNVAMLLRDIAAANLDLDEIDLSPDVFWPLMAIIEHVPAGLFDPNVFDPVLEKTVREFANASAELMAGTRRDRVPTLKGTQGPEGLQL